MWTFASYAGFFVATTATGWFGIQQHLVEEQRGPGGLDREELP